MVPRRWKRSLPDRLQGPSGAATEAPRTCSTQARGRGWDQCGRARNVPLGENELGRRTQGIRLSLRVLGPWGGSRQESIPGGGAIDRLSWIVALYGEQDRTVAAHRVGSYRCSTRAHRGRKTWRLTALVGGPRVSIPNLELSQLDARVREGGSGSQGSRRASRPPQPGRSTRRSRRTPSRRASCSAPPPWRPGRVSGRLCSRSGT